MKWEENSSDVFKAISDVLEKCNLLGSSEMRSEDPCPSHDEVILHCIRLGHEQLGIDVTNIDISGELNPSDFGYLKVYKTNGLTNTLHKVTNTKNGRVVAVRIFGNKTEVFIDRMRERKIQRHLCAQGFAKNVYAYFNGGQIEDWLDGNVLTIEELRSLKYSEAIAQEMRKMHQSPGQAELYLALNPTAKRDGDIKLESMLWPQLWNFYGFCLDHIKELQPIVGSHFNIEDLKPMMERLQRMCNAVNSPVVLCHGDLLNDNIIIHPSGKLSFIDYEYCCFMERGFDIANHFEEFAYVECDFSHIPSEEDQRKFILHYIGEAATDKRIADLYKEIQPFFMAAHFYWGLWGLMRCVLSRGDFDFSHYTISRLVEGINDKRWEQFK